uniref:Uncharacterized protein n=1 Tax=Siphoviridae sp. ctss15 TaxID=2825699 RepID=A0A8S5TRC2_9CAUD|nr:MAG TPA: hypothetical protein [Siphoviridae sp. ctss15]
MTGRGFCSSPFGTLLFGFVFSVARLCNNRHIAPLL